MNLRRENLQALADFTEQQLQAWPMAHANYLGLGATERRRFQLGDLTCFVQYNPARIRSTGARIDKASISARPCFLCRANRPEEQLTGEAAPGWELLVNPYPIFPLHYTLPSVNHEPQAQLPLELATIAERFPGMAVFFNGARAGASAPDHAHMQMVRADELPLIEAAERLHDAGEGGIIDSRRLGDFPFVWKSGVVTPDAEGMKTLAKLTLIRGRDAETGMEDRGLLNAIFWICSRSGLLRAIIIPRQRHRPHCYNKEGEEQMLVSPGTIDMAGVLILPREEDFKRISESNIRQIYAETGIPATAEDYE
ncbi:MAG: DUF4922 domain-containing protein [Muribaculaceae bacterium]|nr:DUF4922 domain-containing protein [Muribaculaceae bacterium]